MAMERDAPPLSAQGSIALSARNERRESDMREIVLRAKKYIMRKKAGNYDRCDGWRPAEFVRVAQLTKECWAEGSTCFGLKPSPRWRALFRSIRMLEPLLDDKKQTS